MLIDWPHRSRNRAIARRPPQQSVLVVLIRKQPVQHREQRPVIEPFRGPQERPIRSPDAAIEREGLDQGSNGARHLMLQDTVGGRRPDCVADDRGTVGEELNPFAALCGSAPDLTNLQRSRDIERARLASTGRSGYPTAAAAPPRSSPPVRRGRLRGYGRLTHMYERIIGDDAPAAAPPHGSVHMIASTGRARKCASVPTLHESLGRGSGPGLTPAAVPVRNQCDSSRSARPLCRAT
jgi:hypothetical protein